MEFSSSQTQRNLPLPTAPTPLLLWKEMKQPWLALGVHVLEALVPLPGVTECHACVSLPSALAWTIKG